MNTENIINYAYSTLKSMRSFYSYVDVSDLERELTQYTNLFNNFQKLKEVINKYRFRYLVNNVIRFTL